MAILQAPQYESQITEAATILERFLTAPKAPAKIAWLLDHQYSPAGLSFSVLKGADAAKIASPCPSRGPLAVRRLSGDRPHRRVRSSRTGRRLLLQIAPESLPALRGEDDEDEDDEDNEEDESFTVATS